MLKFCRRRSSAQCFYIMYVSYFVQFVFLSTFLFKFYEFFFIENKIQCVDFQDNIKVNPSLELKKRRNF